MVAYTQKKLWKPIAIISIIGLVGIALAYSSRSVKPVLSAKPLPMTSTDPAQQIIDMLAQSGSDISKPHKFLFTITYRHEIADGKTSTAVANKIRQYGFSAVKEQDPHWIEWRFNRRVALTTIPTRPALRAAFQRLDRLAKELDGFYDGSWSASIIKN